ncbi:DUF853 family protein, partial [Candidatus Woesearchaeota archaeon]|nr:DUF853 family protein [Candidatus Woesearchaeota archaeon]
DPDGASDIINASIITTAGNCNYRQNTTSGNLFNITYNCTGTSLTATTITVSANDTRSNTTKTTVTLFYPNSIPAQRHDLLFVNYTNGAQFNVSYAVDDSDGAAEMMFRNVSITSGACSYVTNTTSGTLFNVTYNCTGPGASVATVQVNVSDINGTGTQSSLLANVYPVTTPTVAHNIQFVNYTNSHQFNASAAFLDLDGSGDIIRRNISSANCNYLANATSGNLLNITVNCSGTGLTLQKLHINVSDTTGGGINTTESNNTYPNQVPGQRHDLQFVNYTGHNFSVSYAVDDNDGALDIMFRNVSTTSGTCNYRQNTTSGTLFNITYNCTGTSLTTTTVQINISDINGTGTQSSLLTNTYPNQKPAQTNITFTVALTNSQVNLTWNASSDADGDVINYYVLVNGTLQCYTADRNCTFTPASQGQLLWNVTAYDGAENGTVSANNNFTFDSAAPTYYNFSSNASTVTTYNGSVLWVINISDNRQIDAYTFGFNSSGSFANDTPVTVSGVTKFASATKQINATKGKNVCARFYFNDSAGNTNSTTGSCFDVANAAAVFSPALADQSANSGQSFYYDVNCTDFDDDSITYSDNTALFVIDATTGEISDTPAESEVAANTVTITCNDGTVNKQESFVYTILDATAPTYTNLSNNASTVTQTNGAVNWSVTLADGVALKTVMFSFNNSGSFANDTPVTISGTSRAFNVTKTITAAAGKNVCGRFYFNDTSGNQNTTSNSCFNVRVNSNNSVPTTPAIVYPENNSYITSLPIALNSTSTDADGEAITYYHFINDTLNTTSSAANATMNASDGYYAYNAYASDGINDSSNSTKVFFTLDTTKPSISYGPATEATGSSFSRSWVYVNVTASDARESNITFYLYNTTHLYSSVTSTAKARSNNFTGLREGNYSYNVTIVDEAGNSNTTATRTLYLDTAAPVIGNLTVIEATNSTVVIFWNTNENSNDTVEYGLNTSYGSTASNSSNVTRHLVFISGLSQDTTYHYRVSSSDSVMNTNTTADNTFTMPRKIVNLVNTTANQTTTVNSSGIKVLIEIVTLSDSTNSFVNVTAGKETTVNRTVTEDLNVTPLKYVEVKVSGNLTTALSSALLRVDYNETEISDSNISEDTLAMYRYNASKNAWEKLNSTTMGWVLNTSVNTTLNYVWANVTNFSDYGVGGLLANGKPCTTNSSCSSNNCAKGFSSSNTWCAASGGCADNGVTYANGGTACNGDNLQTCSSGSWTSSSCANGCSSGACKAASSGGAGGGAGGGGGGGGGGAAAKQLLKDLTGRAGIRDLSLDANRLTHELTAGEGTTTILTLKNDGNADMQLKIEVKGKAEQLINVQESLTIKAKGTEKLPISIFVPVGTKEGTYSGEIVITSESEKIILPVSIKVKAPIGKEKLLDVRVQPLDTVVSPGDELKVRVDIYNLGEKGGRFDVQLLVELISAESNKTIEKSEEAIAIETSTSVLKLFEIPKDIELGKYIVKATATYSDKEGVHTATAIAHVRVQKPLIEVLKPYLFKKILFVKVWQLLLVMAAMPILLESALKYRAARKRRRRYVVAVNTGKLPKWGARAGWVGKVAETSTNAYVGVDDLTTHTIVAGATGSGKTIASQDIVEEALEKGTAVIVFDPAAQWTGFLRKCQAKQMLARYGAFGMGQKQARAYQGNIRQVTEPRELVDLKGLAEPGKITILALNKLTPKDIDVFVANTIRSVFMANFEESPKLKVLLVFDEVHRLLTKFGGSGDGLVQLERATREFRKWGIGLVLISQVLTDFVGEVKANIATQIQMRTSDEGDLERIKEKYGAVSASIIKASVGTGMLENAEYNDGRAYFVSFRPIRHSVTRLSDEELQKYNRFNDKIDEITSQISQLKELKIDVFDLEIELKLAKEKLSGGNFAMVEVYMESLEPKTKKAWEKLGRKPKAREKKLATIEDIKADVRKAKAERERIVIKENKEKENAGKAALKRGSILIINEKGAATAFKTLQKSLKQYGKGLCFTRTTKQAALAKYKLRNTEIKLITTEPVEGAYSPTSVSAMYGEIKDFISKNGSGAIMIDGMLLIISYAGFEQAYNLMQRIKDAIAAKKITCIIPINLEVLNKEQKKKLAEEFGAVSA